MPRRDNNNTLYIILGVVGAFGFCFFVCCGIGMYKMYSVGQVVMNTVQDMSKLISVDPVEINKAQNEITDINIPVVFSPSILTKAQMVEPNEEEMKEFEDIKKMTEGPFCATIQYQGAGGRTETSMASLELAGFIDPPYNQEDGKQQADYLKDVLPYHYVKQTERIPLPDAPSPDTMVTQLKNLSEKSEARR